MGVIIRYLLMVTIAICLTSVECTVTGLATFFDPPYVPSACFGNQNQGNLVAGVSDDLWDSGAACGKSFEVACTGATNQGDPQPCLGEAVTVMIVDHNPGAAAIINLSADAFAKIANLDAGSVYVTVNTI
uniref:Expansin-like EG45 domain-containing protein n=1 Tax=Quercus lobata TaxID=97700 RepID=A0A7N2L1T2_QUELO